MRNKINSPGFYLGLMVLNILLIAIVLISIGLYLGRYYFPVNQRVEDNKIQYSYYSPENEWRSKDPALDSLLITETYLWNRIKPSNIRDTIILTVVLNSDSIWTPDWLLAQAWVESRWVDTIWSKDTLGNRLCCGVMQIYPGTARMVGRDPQRLTDAKYNIETAYIYYQYLTEFHNSYIRRLNGYTGGSISFSWFYHWYVMNQAEELRWLK